MASLRGVAALLVFISHVPLYKNCPDIGFILGRIGVVCFFLMTGYLATAARVRRSAKQYLLNRFLRLYPVFWLLLLLTFFELGTESFPIRTWLANITLFEEFLFQPKIIGPSWMLPMQVVFFLTLVVKGIEFFVDKDKSRQWNESRWLLLISTIMILSVATGFARYKTQMPFPTAFFLLQGVAYLGIYYKEMKKGLIGISGLKKMFIIFEVGFIIAAGLSYENALSYFIAYNIGFILFYYYHHFNINSWLSIEIGKIGFTLFLGAEIPFYFVLGYLETESILGLWMEVFLKFVLAVVFAYLITRYVEKPILRYGKCLERKIS